MFIQLAYLRHCLPGWRQRGLDELPKSLDETHERTLGDIKDKNWEREDHLFQCVAAASRRPLGVEELAESLAFDFEAEPTLECKVYRRPEVPRHALLSICDTLLSLLNEDHSPLWAIQFTDILVNEYPLAKYAGEHWIGYSKFKQVSPHLQDRMKRLDVGPKNRYFSIWPWIYDSQRHRFRFNRPGYTSQDNETPLRHVALYWIHDVIKFLVVERLWDVNARGSDFDDTPLGLTCPHSQARVLLKHDPDKEIQCRADYSPLHHASLSGSVDIVRFLLERGADVTALGNRKNITLYMAPRSGNASVVGVLLERGADVNARNIYNRTPLHEASNDGYAESSRVLLEHRADTDARNTWDETRSHLISPGGYLDLTQLLFQRRCSCVGQPWPNTPSQNPSERGHQDVIQSIPIWEHGPGGSKGVIITESRGSC